jgi:peroxiredoxin Q/BCP
MLKEGDQAPLFSLPNQDGETVSLSDFADENVIFWFYPRASTPG